MNNSFSQCNHFHVTVFNALALFFATFGDQFTATIFFITLSQPQVYLQQL